MNFDGQRGRSIKRAETRMSARSKTASPPSVDLGQRLGMITQPAKVNKGVGPIAFHGHDAQVAAEVTCVAPANGQAIPSVLTWFESFFQQRRVKVETDTDAVAKTHIGATHLTH